MKINLITDEERIIYKAFVSETNALYFLEEIKTVSEKLQDEAKSVFVKKIEEGFYKSWKEVFSSEEYIAWKQEKLDWWYEKYDDSKSSKLPMYEKNFFNKQIEVKE